MKGKRQPKRQPPRKRRAKKGEANERDRRPEESTEEYENRMMLLDASEADWT